MAASSELYVFKVDRRHSMAVHTGLVLKRANGHWTRCDHGYGACSRSPSPVQRAFLRLSAVSGSSATADEELGDAGLTHLRTAREKAEFEKMVEVLVLACRLPWSLHPTDDMLLWLHENIMHPRRAYNVVSFNCRSYCKQVLRKLEAAGVKIEREALIFLNMQQAKDATAVSAVGVFLLAPKAVLLVAVAAILGREQSKEPWDLNFDWEDE
eukprot:m.116708 g.116708  ORF g.116708 m.116708 type:complete len:211 (-) comp19442_c3_seq2:48-680(-)